MSGLNIHVPRHSPALQTKSSYSSPSISTSSVAEDEEAEEDDPLVIEKLALRDMPTAVRHHSHSFTAAAPPPTKALPKLPPSAHTISNLTRNISTEFGPTTASRTMSSIKTPYPRSASASPPPSVSPHVSRAFYAPSSPDSSQSLAGPEIPVPSFSPIVLPQYSPTSFSPVLAAGMGSGGNTPNPGWSSAIGRANLGKSGRVIEKLMSDNDKLKRDINIERTRAEENGRAVKAMESRMETMQQEHETELHLATANKSSLMRAERKMEDLRAQLELERAKTKAAVDGERYYREEIERIRSDAEAQVHRATERAKYFEMEYDTIAAHWPQKRREMQTALDAMKQDVLAVVDRAQASEARHQKLELVCRQQAQQIAHERRTNERIWAQFHDHKRVEAAALHDIKEGGKVKEAETERLLHEAVELSGRLKWALNVKDTIPQKG